MHDVNIYVYVKRRLSFECTKEILNLQLEGLAGIAIAGTIHSTAETISYN